MPGAALEQSAAEGATAAAAADLRTLLAAAGPATLEGLTLPLLSAAPALIPGHAPALQLIMAVADAGTLTRVAGAVSLSRLSCCFAPRVTGRSAAERASADGRSGGSPDAEAEAGSGRHPKGERSSCARGTGRGAKRRRAGSWEESDDDDEEGEGPRGRAAGKGGAAKRGAPARGRQSRSARAARSKRAAVSDSDEDGESSASDAEGSNGEEEGEEEEDEEDGEPRQARGRAAGAALGRAEPPAKPAKDDERAPQPADAASAAAAARDLAATAAGWDAGTRRGLYHVLAAEALAAGPGFARGAAAGLLAYLGGALPPGNPAQGFPGRRPPEPGVDAEAAVGAAALLRGVPADAALLRQLLALPVGHHALAAAALAAWRAQGACSGGAGAAEHAGGVRGGKARGRGGGRAGARGESADARQGLRARVAAALQAAAASAESGRGAAGCACLRDLWGLDAESESDV